VINDADHHYRLGRFEKDRGDGVRAEHFYREALRLKPDHVDAWVSLGILLRALERYSEAEACHREALRLDPENFQATLGLGNALLLQSRYRDAAEVLRGALILNSQSAKAGMSLGIALLDLAEKHDAAGNFDAAKAHYEEALSLRPGDADARFQYARFLLRHGDFANGWKFYESRLAGDDGQGGIANRQAMGKPRWRGERTAGTLLVVGEQGIGDEMMFASILPEVIRDVGHCVIACDERLVPLFSRSFPQATVDGTMRGKKEGEGSTSLPAKAFDYWISVGSLPGLYRASADKFPARTGYLVADESRTARWRERLAALGPGLKVGVSWRGGTVGSAKSARRSLSLAQLQPVLSMAGVQFVSLQYGDVQKEIAGSPVAIHHWQEAIDDYEETAALIAALDLVITVCTAAVHLSGALGKRTWVMTPVSAAAAYGTHPSSMVWYPQVKLFRQQQVDEWSPVIADLAQCLRDEVSG
jgi:Tfp pilus assembly protein PilF